MSAKVPCSKCGAMILPATAEATGGVCMPCKQGNRENLERSKEYYRKQKEYNPVRELWLSLVNRVHKTDQGFVGLNQTEKLYFSVCVLEGEVYNGGFHQFFSNSSGEYYSHVVDALLELRAFESLKLLREAKEILFGDLAVPDDHMERNRMMRDYPNTGIETTPWCIRLEQIDNEYCRNPDGLADKIDGYAETHGLVQPFKK